MMIAKYIRKKIPLLLTGLLLVVSSAAFAAEEFRVNLIATIDDGPAMENVTWKVYRNGTEFTTANKHSTHVKVPPGKYTVKASLTSDSTVERERTFYVRNDTKVIVPMDK